MTWPRGRVNLKAFWTRFATTDASAEEFIAGIAQHAHEYGRFNLLLWDGQSLHCVGNHPRFHAEEVGPGVHALSNAQLDADWPKARRASRALSEWLRQQADVEPDLTAASRQAEPLFIALADSAPAADDELPETGVGLDLERRLSPPFVLGDTYGTRCSTLVLASSAGIAMSERRFGANGIATGSGGFVQCEA